MVIADRTSDLLARIRNARAVEKKIIRLPLTKFSKSLAKALKRKGLIKKVTVQNDLLKITLSDLPFLKLKTVSRLSQRMYIKAKDIKPLQAGFRIISTPRGLMSEKEAKKQGLGGEIICEVS